MCLVKTSRRNEVITARTMTLIIADNTRILGFVCFCSGVIMPAMIRFVWDVVIDVK